MRDDPPRRGAALAGGADGAEQDGADGKLEVGVLGDDDGVVAAQFEECAAEAAGDDFGDAAPDGRRTGERNQRQATIRQHRLADRAAGSDGEGEHGGDTVIGHDPIGDLLDRDRAERGRFGWLPDHRVTAHRRNRRVPGPDRDGKVERGDHADRAERVPLFHHAVARPFRRDGQAIELS